MRTNDDDEKKKMKPKTTWKRISIDSKLRDMKKELIEQKIKKRKEKKKLEHVHIQSEET